jgi:hypothetical protein
VPVNPPNSFLAPSLIKAILPLFLKEGWLSPVEGTRLEIERGRNVTVGSNPTPSATSAKADLVTSRGMKNAVRTERSEIDPANAGPRRGEAKPNQSHPFRHICESRSSDFPVG